MEIGEIIRVRVSEVHSYGVLLVAPGGSPGFMQILELSWDEYGLQDRVNDLCNPGEELLVKVIAVGEDRFYASLRQVTPEKNPWSEANVLRVGQVYEGEVVLVAEYGYLVKIRPLGAIARLPSQEEKLRKGDVISVAITEVDAALRRAELAVG